MATAAGPRLLIQAACLAIALAAILAPAARAEEDAGTNDDVATKAAAGLAKQQAKVLKAFFKGGKADSTDATTTSDGLPSASVIKYFFPKAIEFALGENCQEPAQKGQSLGVAVYHASVHPKNSEAAMVTFALLFNRDCGHAGHQGAVGIGSHKGDAEFFHYTMKKDSTCSQGWRLHAIKTVAHGGDFGRREVNEEQLDSCEPPARLVSSLGKHALYLSWEDCAARTPAEVCLKGFEAGFTLYDSGTSAETGPDLSQWFGTDTLWNNDGHFCGGVSVLSRSKSCISFTVDKIVNPGNYLQKHELPDPGLGGSKKCPYGSSLSAGLCYKDCDEGYKGFVTNCVPGCPSGYRDDGLFCAKPGSYGRGGGHVSNKLCEKKEHADCEKWGLLSYPKCREGFKAFGCCVCTPVCPSGMTDIGVSCAKPTKDRGAGVIP